MSNHDVNNSSGKKMEHAQKSTNENLESMVVEWSDGVLILISKILNDNNKNSDRFFEVHTKRKNI